MQGFVNCFGLIDGMLFPFAFAPMLNGDDYSTRKGNYTIKGLIICDDTAKISWLRWDGPAVYKTTGYGQIVMCICRKTNTSTTGSI